PEEYRIAWAHRSEFDVYNPEITEISEETAEERKKRLKNLTPEQKEEREKAKQLYGKVSEEFTKRHKQTVTEFAAKHSGTETDQNAVKWFRDWWFNELNRQVEERLGESRYVRFFPDDTP